MWRFLLIFIALAKIGNCCCPDGFELVRDGECRGSIGNFTLIQYQVIDTAIAKCNSIHAHPIIIHNDEHQTYWSGRGYGSIAALQLLGLDRPCKTGESFFVQANGV